MPKENKKVKNSVLIDLFYEDESAERNQISLYNALHEKPLPDGTKIMPLRVENIIYMNFQNDFSYELDIEVQREEAYEDGLRAGEKTGKLEEKNSLIVKKVRRGKDLQTIADELEEPVDEVRKIYEAVMKAAPDYDMKMIRESLA